MRGTSSHGTAEAERAPTFGPGSASFRPGSASYRAGTSPRNTSARQRPALLLRPRSSSEVASAVALARARGARLSVQATGHGAARTLGPETVLVHTGALTSVQVDAEAQGARVGAGVTWADVQQRAERHALFGLAGTAPSVGVAGYTFGGGVGWFARPYGLAAGRLRAVRYVDGLGRVRMAADDASEDLDRRAIWAFRGGAPVGIATELHLDLVRPGPVWAGHLLWSAAAAQALISTWAEALPGLPDTVTSTMAMLQLPPSGPFPIELLGAPVVHLSYAAVGGEPVLHALREQMRAVATPAVDSTGPADAQRLGQIHLDPPEPVAARGGGRWLTRAAEHRATELLLSAGVGHPGGAAMAELRHVGTRPPVYEGALTQAPGPFLLHVVGHGDPASQATTRAAVARSMAMAADLDAGVDPVSFRDGDETATDLSPRLAEIAAALDPDGVFSFERIPRR